MHVLFDCFERLRFRRFAFERYISRLYFVHFVLEIHRYLIVFLYLLKIFVILHQKLAVVFLIGYVPDEKRHLVLDPRM